jgi:broad specificity phosphatase PhoE
VTKRRLILIRHSLSAVRPDVPPAKWHLAPEGVTRAKAFAGRLDLSAASQIFSSAEPKAVETARVLGEVWGRPVAEVPDLHEHERPEHRMVSRQQFAARIAALFARPSEIVFGSESADGARQRFTAAVSGLVDRHDGDIVIVTHGTVMALFIASHTGKDAFELWKQLQMPCAATLTLPDYGSLVTVN